MLIISLCSQWIYCIRVSYDVVLKTFFLSAIILYLFLYDIHNAYSSIHIICKLKYSYDMHTYMNMHTHMLTWVHTATRTYINTHRWCTSDWNAFIYMHMLLNYYFTVIMDKWRTVIFSCLFELYACFLSGRLKDSGGVAISPIMLTRFEKA